MVFLRSFLSEEISQIKILKPAYEISFYLSFLPAYVQQVNRISQQLPFFRKMKIPVRK